MEEEVVLVGEGLEEGKKGVKKDIVRSAEKVRLSLSYIKKFFRLDDPKLSIGHTVLVLVLCDELNEILMGFSPSTGALVVLTAATEREEDAEAWLCAAA
ncbi:hypothetical protein KY284_001009 [Solanum tuberosum]|nr:hypothetical protein KY284_001009 [Solanum tuberosum]